MKNKYLSGTIAFTFLIIVAFCFAVHAHTAGYWVRYTHFTNLSTYSLAGSIQTSDMVVSAIFLIAWLALAFICAKWELKGVFTAMLLYSVLPFIGLIGIPLAQNHKGIGAVIINALTFVWAAPIMPLLFTSGNMEAMKASLGISMIVLPALAAGVYYIRKTVQY